MRYLFGFICVCTLGGTLPLSTSAQDAEQGTTSEPNLQEPAPSSEPASEQPALQLKLDDAGVEVAPSPPRTEYLKAPVRRARGGLSVSVIAFGGGVAMMGVAFANIEFLEHLCLSEPCPQTPPWAIPVAVTGLVLTIGGLAGMILSGRRLTHLKKQLRWYADAPESRDGTPRRVQWDLARSRVVF
jgi:hypothetical protein